MNEDDVPDAWHPLLDNLRQRRDEALQLGGAARVEREHAHGRWTARERIQALVDPGSFQEFGVFVTTPMDDGSRKPSTFICGLARVDGRPVCVGAEDFTVQGGGVGVHLKRYKGAWGGFVEELAYGYCVPLVLLLQGVGGSVTMQEEKGFAELISSTGAFPIFELLDRVPVVCAVLGPTAGSSAARAVISHFSLMTRDNGCLFAGGPPLVKQALGIDIDKLALGGAEVHTRLSGLIDNAVDDDAAAIDEIRAFLSYMPLNVLEMPPATRCDDPVDRSCSDLLKLMSPDSKYAYDPVSLVEVVVDQESFFEIAPDFGTSVRIGLARLGGHVVGVLATDPRHLAGALDVSASEKQTRFVEMCDAFHIPLVYFVDVPGFMIGPEAESSGVLRKGARAIQAIHRANIPVFTVQARRSYGLAALATGNLDTRSVRLAWPSGNWGDLPVGGGIEAAYGDVIAAADDPDAKRKELLATLERQVSPWRTVEKFGLDEMIDPRETRSRLAQLVNTYYLTHTPTVRSGPQVRP